MIVGPMKSGKSLELLARMAPYGFAEQRVLYIQSDRNVRDEGVSSRIGINSTALKVASLKEVPSDFDVIGIDEIHMFDSEDARIIAQWLRDETKTVFISGLDLDYRGVMPAIIRDSLQLKPDSIISKIAVCDVCKKYRAQFTQILHDGEAVLTGLPTIVPEDGSYEYQARCRWCFVTDK